MRLRLLFTLVFLLFVRPAWGATYWVISAGGAANCAAASGATDPGQYRTLAQGIACLSSGDTLMLKLDDYGTGAAGRITGLPNNVTVRTEAVAGQARVSWINVQSNSNISIIGSVFGGVRNLASDPEWINTGVTNGTAATIAASTTVRLENVELTRGFENGVIVQSSSGVTFVNVYSHNNGWGTHNGGSGGNQEVCLGSNPYPQGGPGGSDPGKCHGIYVQSGSSDITIDNGLWENNNGYGIHACASGTDLPNVIVKNITARNNASTGIGQCFSTGGQVFNNESYGNGGDAGILIGADVAQKIYSNTVYNNTGKGIYFNQGTASSQVDVKNNLVIGNAGTAIDCASCTDINNLTTGTAASHWADPANGDFRLCTAAGAPTAACTGASTALIGGTTLGTPWNVDKIGTSRPQGASYSRGAFERTGTTPPVTPLNVLRMSGDSVATDTSGQGNNGTLTGGATYAAGVYNNGFSLDGINDFVSVPDSNSLDMSTGFTLAAWVDLTAPQTGLVYAIAKENPGAGDGSYYLAASSVTTCGAGGIFGGYIQGGVAVLACHATPLSAAPHHLAVTYDATTTPQVRLYKDGVEITNSSAGGATLSAGTGTLTIGSGNAQAFFPGVIDEVWIFNYALALTGANDNDCVTNWPGDYSIRRIKACSINALTAPSNLGVKIGTVSMKVGTGTLKVGN